MASMVLWPNDVAIDLIVTLVHCSTVQDDRDHQDNADHPGKEGHYPRYERSSQLLRGDGMTHCYVSISAHDGQEDATGELVDASQSEIELADF